MGERERLSFDKNFLLNERGSGMYADRKGIYHFVLDGKEVNAVTLVRHLISEHRSLLSKYTELRFRMDGLEK